MALVSIEEAMEYLRVDSSDETVLIESFLIAAEKMCIDVARLSKEQWAAINATPRKKSTDDTDDESEDESGDELDDEEDEPGDECELACKKVELKQVRALMKAAVFYSLAYLYEHREEADHHELVLTLRNLLFSLREGVI